MLMGMTPAQRVKSLRELTEVYHEDGNLVPIQVMVIESRLILADVLIQIHAELSSIGAALERANAYR